MGLSKLIHVSTDRDATAVLPLIYEYAHTNPAVRLLIVGPNVLIAMCTLL